MVVVIKYNAGNIHSVVHALRRIGIDPVVTDDKELIQKADKVIFPGVGEDEKTMKYLKERGLDTLIKSLTQPVLGICLGMQLMCKHSEEGNVDCLGIFDIEVKKFVEKPTQDKAIELLDDLALNILYDDSNKNADPFWEKTSADYFSGVALGLFEDAKADEININSISLATTVGEEKFGGSTYIKEYYAYETYRAFWN